MGICYKPSFNVSKFLSPWGSCPPTKVLMWGLPTLSCYCSECSSYFAKNALGHIEKRNFLAAITIKWKKLDSLGPTKWKNTFGGRTFVIKSKITFVFNFLCEPCAVCICRDCTILHHVEHRKISPEKALKGRDQKLELKCWKLKQKRPSLNKTSKII